MIKYGLISQVDARCLEKTIDLICEDMGVSERICVTEVGIYSGQTGHGIASYINSKCRKWTITGVDNGRDGEKNLFEHIYHPLIIGNSSEVYNQIEDESQHLILIDALHTKLAVISDFFAFAPKVKPGGFLCFHDTGKHLDPLSGWQGIGDKNDPDFCLGGVRKALSEIGLLGRPNGVAINMEAIRELEITPEKAIELFNETGYLYGASQLVGNRFPGWELVFDEADPEDSGGGICVFKKLF